jgi:hypothetical protein
MLRTMLPSTAAGLIGATLLPGCAAWTEAGRLPVESGTAGRAGGLMKAPRGGLLRDERG